jgi:NADH-quinone oxidoreductase subunit A
MGSATHRFAGALAEARYRASGRPTAAMCHGPARRGERRPLAQSARRETVGAAMVRSYLPAVVFVLVGAGMGAFFAAVNARCGAPERRSVQRREPYECGLPSRPIIGRFTVGFYLVALMFLIFDIEVVLLFPASVVLRELGVHALLAIVLFVGLLGVAFVYEWRRGVLDWGAGRDMGAGPHSEEAAGPQRSMDPVARDDATERPLPS